ncbi:MAG: alanine-zipper protein, partial [Gemmatimonadota bacterium]|nr:alanine-zipper protein [Gemmatimonadota bacterium]
MAFVWDLIQQIQLHNNKSRAQEAREKAKSAAERARTAETRARKAEVRARTLEERLLDVEQDVDELRVMMGVLLERLERRLGESAE